MAKLNQIVAVVNGKKSAAQKLMTAVYKKVQKPDLFSGLVRTYTPVDQDGDGLPPEKTKVRFTVEDAIDEVRGIMGNLMNVIATQDHANTEAAADIVLGENVLVANVPVTHLMFLEKQLVDLHTFVSALPVLDETSEWHFDENKGCHVSEPEVKNRDLKEVTHRVVYEATPQHPAQIAEVAITKKAGEFTTTRLSGAVGVSRKRQLIKKVVDLQEAVKYAREQANSIEVTQKTGDDAILSYIFG